MQRRSNKKAAKTPMVNRAKKALYGGAAMGLAMSLGMTSAIAGLGNDNFETVTPCPSG